MKPSKDSSVVPTVLKTEDAADPKTSEPPAEVGGPKGPEPTRFGDWEQKGRCTDF